VEANGQEQVQVSYLETGRQSSLAPYVSSSDDGLLKATPDILRANKVMDVLTDALQLPEGLPPQDIERLSREIREWTKLVSNLKGTI